MLLESPWTTLLKSQLSVPWQPERQENGEHPQGGSSSLAHPLWGSQCGSSLCIARIEQGRERHQKRTKGSASSRGKPEKPGRLTLERRWVWRDHDFLMNLSFKEQRWVWNLVTWERGSNLLKRKAFVSRKPKALLMVLVVPQSNQDCSSDLLLPVPALQEALQMARQCPVFCRKSNFCCVTHEPMADPIHRCAVLLELLRRSRGPEISNRAEVFPMSHAFAPFFCPTCLSVFFHYVVCSCVPKEKKLYVCPLCSL